MKKNILGLLLILCTITAFAEPSLQSPKVDEIKSGDVTKVRVAPKAGPGERQLTCDEIDKLELLPNPKHSSTSATLCSSKSL